MAMLAGSVSIDADGVATGSGFALALAEAKLEAYDELGLPSDPNALAAVYAGIAAECNLAATVITYIQANAEVSGSAVT